MSDEKDESDEKDVSDEREVSDEKGTCCKKLSPIGSDFIGSGAG